MNKLKYQGAAKSFEMLFALVTNQGVAGSIPASRTTSKIRSSQCGLFSF
jgi:hypothetical protein